MKAVICERYGPPEVLKIKDIPKPVPKKGEVLIKVMSAPVNSGDVRIRALRVDDSVLGLFSKVIMRFIIGFRGPRKKVLGAALSGVIEEIGDEVDMFKTGDEVFAMTGLKFGGFAEYAVLPQNKAIALKPKNASFEEAAALPFGGTTALYFLRKASVKNASKVLIYGSSGAVGTAAVQVAKYYGADVTTVSGESGVKLSKKLGASVAYDYKKQSVADLPETYDIVFDAVGKIDKKESTHLLSEGGKFITVAGVDVAKELASDLKQLALMYDDGSFEAVIDSTYRLDKIVEANRYVDTGQKKGNVVVTIG